MDSLKGVNPGVPAQELQELIIKTEGEGDAHDTQKDVGDHSDGTKLEQAGQTDYQPCKHHTSPPHVAPVHQIHNCKAIKHKTSS